MKTSIDHTDSLMSKIDQVLGSDKCAFFIFNGYRIQIMMVAIN